jgi:hypothetical protein
VETKRKHIKKHNTKGCEERGKGWRNDRREGEEREKGRKDKKAELPKVGGKKGKKKKTMKAMKGKNKREARKKVFWVEGFESVIEGMCADTTPVREEH